MKLRFWLRTIRGRREALEEIRHSVADRLGVASCLEIGPRYLHSTGQLHKGGPNEGVFLIISAEEPKASKVFLSHSTPSGSGISSLKLSSTSENGSNKQ